LQALRARDIGFLDAVDAAVGGTSNPAITHDLNDRGSSCEVMGLQSGKPMERRSLVDKL